MLVGKLQGVIVKTFLLPYEFNIKAGLWLRGPGAGSRVDSGGALAEFELPKGTPSMPHSFFQPFSSTTKNLTLSFWIHPTNEWIRSQWGENGLMSEGSEFLSHTVMWWMTKATNRTNSGKTQLTDLHWVLYLAFNLQKWHHLQCSHSSCNFWPLAMRVQEPPINYYSDKMQIEFAWQKSQFS